MRQKQSKKNSRKQEQRSSPAVKHEAEALPISTNTIDKSELSISEEHTPVHMQDSVPKEELEQGLDQELEERYERYRDALNVSFPPEASNAKRCQFSVKRRLRSWRFHFGT